MTTFTAPLIVRALDSDVTAASIEASGTATFAGNLVFSGSQTITQQVQASSSATFRERIQVGDAGQRGTVIVAQRATIGANTTAGAPATIVLPSGSDIVDFRVDVEVPFATAAGATAAAIRASIAAGTGGVLFEMAVSASTTPYGLDRANTTTFTGSNMRNVSATIEAHVSVQGSPSAMTAGQAMLTVFYVVP